jgi:hypothetical protein
MMIAPPMLVLNFCSIVLRVEKHHPRLRSFDWRRMNLQLSDGLSLTFGSTMMFFAFGNAAKIYVPMPPYDCSWWCPL